VYVDHNWLHLARALGVPKRLVKDEAVHLTYLLPLFGSNATHSPSRRALRPLAVLLGLTALLAVVGQPVAADMGPKPHMDIHVTYEGGPVPDAAFQARVLTCAAGDEVPYQKGQPLPGLEQVELQDPAGCRWQEPDYPVWGGDCTDGRCWFSYRLPPRFRLAVYLPSQDRLFVTDAAERRGIYDSFVADLSPDGTGRLRPATGLARAWTVQGIAAALPLTLAVETAAILLFAQRRRQPCRRLLLTGLVANLLTLPGVWAVAGLAAMLGGPQAGLVALGLLELGAWEVEGAAYATFGRLSLGAALLLSVIANAASLGLGLLVH
jgi:hypothetical protein